MTQRVKTGISGFDDLIDGGFPKGFIVLLAGTPGTGKTLFSMEYAYTGAKTKEKTMYVTFEQNLSELRDQAKKIGMDLKKFEDSGDLILMHIPIARLTPDMIDDIKNKVRDNGVKRLVIDSLTTLSVNAPIYTPIKDIALRDIMNYKAFFSPPILGDFVIKRFLYAFLADIKDLGCTTLVTSEAPEKGEYISRDTVSEFIADGVLSFTFEALGGDFSRSLLVRKMRGTAHDEDIHPVEITKEGLVIHRME